MSLRFLRKWKSQSEDGDKKCEITSGLDKKIKETRETRRERLRVEPGTSPEANFVATSYGKLRMGRNCHDV